MSVVRQDEDDVGLDFSADAPLPEEVSPYDPSIENRPLLYVQILDDKLQPRRGLSYEVSGQGMNEARSGTTDENGELLLDDCAAGLYELRAAEKSCVVHTLSQLDLDQDGTAYRVVL